MQQKCNGLVNEALRQTSLEQLQQLFVPKASKLRSARPNKPARPKKIYRPLSLWQKEAIVIARFGSLQRN